MKTMKLLFTLLIVAIAVNGFGQNITGSAHDFRDGSGGVETWNGSGEICLPCHAPHNNVDPTTTAGLLWNHTLAANGSYTPYASLTMDATAPATVTGSSVLCLSCHDGTVGLEQFGNNPGGVAADMTTIFPEGDFGTDLSNDHPISFAYSDGGTGLAAEGASTAVGGTIATDLLYGGAGGDVECSSCHDVHDAQDNLALLKIDNAASALCLTCHLK